MHMLESDLCKKIMVAGFAMWSNREASGGVGDLCMPHRAAFGLEVMLQWLSKARPCLQWNLISSDSGKNRRGNHRSKGVSFAPWGNVRSPRGGAAWGATPAPPPALASPKRLPRRRTPRWKSYFPQRKRSSHLTGNSHHCLLPQAHPFGHSAAQRGRYAQRDQVFFPNYLCLFQHSWKGEWAEQFIWLTIR